MLNSWQVLAIKKKITGSTLEFVPLEFVPGDTHTKVLQRFFNGSMEDEWLLAFGKDSVLGFYVELLRIPTEQQPLSVQIVF